MKTITIIQKTLIVSGLLMLLAGAWLRRSGSDDPRGRKKMLFWCGFVLTLLGAATATEFGSGFLEGVMFGK